jgi:hypothetical protein
VTGVGYTLLRQPEERPAPVAQPQPQRQPAETTPVPIARHLDASLAF